MEAGREIEKIGSTGRAIAHVEVEIRDDRGNRLPPGEDGEICLRGPKVTKGYWKDPDKTAAAFFGDWFRTGDVGHLDAEGFLYLTDRKKDMIISGGENIASSEVERVIYELPRSANAPWSACPTNAGARSRSRSSCSPKMPHSISPLFRSIAGHGWPASRCRGNS